LRQILIISNVRVHRVLPGHWRGKFINREFEMRSSCLVWAAAAWIVMGCVAVKAADPLAIETAIQDGANSLLSDAQNWNGDNTDQGLRALCALALVKAHVDVDTPAITKATQAILTRCTVEDGYKPSGHHYYGAGVDATLLVEVGEAQDQPQLYQSQIKMIADYIIAGQLASGGWDYPDGHGGVFSGDTSVTQYAMLGLWAATRAGIEVPNSVFDRCIGWHFSTQQPDGGFVYCPGTNAGHEQGASSLNMTAAAIGSILIAARHLYPNQAERLFEGAVRDEVVEQPEDDSLANGQLERVDIDAPPENGASTATDPEGSTPISQIQQSVQRAAGWLGPRFVNNNEVPHSAYYYYSVERAGSLAGITHIGPHDWYHFCADYLISNQNEDGSWSMGSTSSNQDTAFVILFLALSTGQIVGTPVVPDPAGAGLQAGGRGLPENLNDVRMVDGRVTVPPNLGPTSDLLSELANIDDASIAEVQEAIIKDVVIGDREQWIARKDELAELAAHPNAEVRRTAIWALGRTGDMSLAKLLITALEDHDAGVNVEANNALCWLSRRPNGFNLSVDPLGGLPTDAGQEQIEAVMAAWRSEAVQQWGSWYLRHRPFADRGDEFEANLRQKLGR
jgi:hypothetical protein